LIQDLEGIVASFCTSVRGLWKIWNLGVDRNEEIEKVGDEVEGGVESEEVEDERTQDREKFDGGAKSEVDMVDEGTERGGDGVRILKALLEVEEVEVLTSVLNFRY
jgi:hypothetical protein